jgi:hypothetical protein
LPSALLPLRSRLWLRHKLLLRSNSPAELPNPYSHSSWYKIWGQVSTHHQRRSLF